MVEERKMEYYKTIGWDKRGIPKTETLQKLGLDNVDRTLKRLRK